MFFQKSPARFIVCFTVCMLIASLVKAQAIKGTIVDDDNGKPLGGVSVYLNGTFKGTSTDGDGAFLINTNEVDIPLIVSFIGYETQTIDKYAGKILLIRLKHKEHLLKEVTIGFDSMSREEKMKIFLADFIGTSNRDCVITNPDDISFTYHKKTQTLMATAEEPLVIINKKLGYKITYFLDLYKHVPTGLVFQGNYFFAEDTLGLKPKEVKKVLKERDNVYFGSRMHLIRSLWANSLKENKFSLQFSDRPAEYNDLVVARDSQKFIRYKNVIYINYKGGASAIRQFNQGRETFIAANGFNDPNISWSGDITAERVGELLPFEFQPIKR